MSLMKRLVEKNSKKVIEEMGGLSEIRKLVLRVVFSYQKFHPEGGQRKAL